jgi:hypothetical protein
MVLVADLQDLLSVVARQLRGQLCQQHWAALLLGVFQLAPEPPLLAAVVVELNFVALYASAVAL